MDLQQIGAHLRQLDNGIWYGNKPNHVSYSSDAYGECFAVEDHSFWFRHRNLCISAAVKQFPPSNNGYIFDIGGGNGVVAGALIHNGFNVVLVEPGQQGAFNAVNRGIKNVICATTESAGFMDNSLPAVGLFDVIEHIEDDISFLRNIHRLLMDNGRLYATVPAYQRLWSSEDQMAGHFRRYSLNSFRKTLESSGYIIDYSTYIFRFLPIPIYLSRTIPYLLRGERHSISSYETGKDHAIKKGAFTGIMGWLLEPEVKNIEQQKLMRFGGSCLVVATKPTNT